MIVAGLLLLVGLAVWKSTLLPVVGIAALFILSVRVRATAPNRPLPRREPIALLIAFALSLAFMLFVASDILVYDGSLKFFGFIAVLHIFAIAATAVLAACFYLQA